MWGFFLWYVKLKVVKTTKLFLLSLIILSIWVYYPGLSGSFIFDDYHNISANEHLKINDLSFDSLRQAALSGDSGLLKRPVSMLSFALNHVFSGMEPWSMKLTNLFIHLFNGLLVLIIVRQLFHRLYDNKHSEPSLLPYFITGIWLVHPINVTAVSYIVQRMTSLSATFVLMSLCCYLKLRESHCHGWKAYLLSTLLLSFWALGLLSKETAILLSVYIFVIEFCVYRFKLDEETSKVTFHFLWFVLALPWIGAFFYIIYEPSFILKGYAIRDFTITERVLTEFRIVSEYIRLIIIPDVQQMGLFHDDIVLSKSILSPITTLLSIVFLLGLLILAFIVRKRYALFSLGLLWFLGGHLLESTVISLELMYLHRNYLPSIGILIMIAAVGEHLTLHYRKWFLIAGVLILLFFSISTRSLAHQWSGDLRMLLIEVMNNPDSIRANFRAGQALKFYARISLPGEQREQYKNKAIEYFSKIENKESRNIAGELAILETYIQLEEAPSKDLVEKLINKLPISYVDRSVINLFKSINQCFLIKEKCTLTSQQYESMLEAFFNNKYIGNDIKRIILIIKAHYFMEYKDNVDIAITIVLEAILLVERLDDFMLLAQLYEKGEYYNEMQRTIEYIQKYDLIGQFKKPIKKLLEQKHNKQLNFEE